MAIGAIADLSSRFAEAARIFSPFVIRSLGVPLAVIFLDQLSCFSAVKVWYTRRRLIFSARN
jgi:hypothetical protein